MVIRSMLNTRKLIQVLLITGSCWGLLGLWGCAAPMGEAAIQSQSATVVLDTFSGRPNLDWHLSTAETLTLTTMLDTLPPSAEERDIPERLGYRSFWVELPDRVINVYGGIVRERSDQGVRYFTDANQQVERWLYVTSKPYLEPLAPGLYSELDALITEGGHRP